MWGAFEKKWPPRYVAATRVEGRRRLEAIDHADAGLFGDAPTAGAEDGIAEVGSAVEEGSAFDAKGEMLAAAGNVYAGFDQAGAAPLVGRVGRQEIDGSSADRDERLQRDVARVDDVGCGGLVVEDGDVDGLRGGRAGVVKRISLGVVGEAVVQLYACPGYGVDLDRSEHADRVRGELLLARGVLG